jgi:hypothetical protein
VIAAIRTGARPQGGTLAPTGHHPVR